MWAIKFYSTELERNEKLMYKYKAVIITTVLAILLASGTWTMIMHAHAATASATAPAVGMAGTSDNGGYWIATQDGAVYSFGNAVYHGGANQFPHNGTIVGMAATSTNGGYWEVGSDGGVYSFGDAVFHGSMGGQRLNAPIVGMARTSTNAGYWLVGADGGIFSFGDAVFHGSMGGQHLNAPIVGLLATSDNGGYWEVGSDGGIFTFGNAHYYGNVTYPPPNTTSGLIVGTDRDLAQKILTSGKVTGDSRYIGQIQAYANGNYSCHINPTILSLIYTVVAPTTSGGLNHTVYISSLNRYCTGVITGSGTSSYHYTDGGGHAVDFAKVDGVQSTGTTANDLNLLKQILPRLPRGSGIGQSTCRTGSNVLTMPSGVTQFYDTCDHNHIQVPIQ